MVRDSKDMLPGRLRNTREPVEIPFLDSFGTWDRCGNPESIERVFPLTKIDSKVILLAASPNVRYVFQPVTRHQPHTHDIFLKTVKSWYNSSTFLHTTIISISIAMMAMMLVHPYVSLTCLAPESHARCASEKEWKSAPHVEKSCAPAGTIGSSGHKPHQKKLGLGVSKFSCTVLGSWSEELRLTWRTHISLIYLTYSI